MARSTLHPALLLLSPERPTFKESYPTRPHVLVAASAASMASLAGFAQAASLYSLGYGIMFAASGLCLPVIPASIAIVTVGGLVGAGVSSLLAGGGEKHRRGDPQLELEACTAEGSLEEDDDEDVVI